MTRFLLDTNIVSNAVKPAPSPLLERWMTDQSDDDLFIASLTIAEIWRGILEAPSGRRKEGLVEWFSGPSGPREIFAGRILPFDETAAMVWARLMADGTAAGRPRSVADTIIAAVAEANGCVVATDNERDFAGVSTINPLRGVP